MILSELWPATHLAPDAFSAMHLRIIAAFFYIYTCGAETDHFEEVGEDVIHVSSPPHLTCTNNRVYVGDEVNLAQIPRSRAASTSSSSCSSTESANAGSHGLGRDRRRRSRPASNRTRSPAPVRASSSAPARYELSDHIQYSGAEDSPEVASGCSTPPMPLHTVESLMERVDHQLGALWEAGMDVLVQMLATQLAAMARDREAGTTPAHIYQVLAGMAAGYLTPHMEIGVALPPRWTQWVTALETDVANTARMLDEEAAREAGDDDGTSFMGFPRKRGREAPGKGAAAKDRRRRRTQRPRTAPTPVAPWREPQNDDPGKKPKSTETSRGAPSSSSAAVEDARCANRVTWRSLLAMNDSGPGLDLDARVQRPTDEVQCDNLRATMEGLSDFERMTLMSGFACFLHELNEQVVSIFVEESRQHSENEGGHGAPGGPPSSRRHEDEGDEGEEDDDVMTMQLTLGVLTKTRAVFSNVQYSLDKLETRKGHKAMELLRRLRHLVADMPPALAVEMESLMALLLVYSGEGVGGADDPVGAADVDWAQTWSSRIRQLAQQASIHSSAAASSAPIHVESQSQSMSSDMDPTLLDHPGALVEDDADLLAQVRAFEEREAQRHRRQDEVDFQEEMSKGTKRGRELEVCLQLSAGAEKRTSRFYLPIMQGDCPIQLQMTMRAVEHEEGEKADNDDAHALVQTHVLRTKRGFRQRLRNLLGTLHDHVRSRAAQRVQVHLQRRLQDLVSQIAGILGMVESTQFLEDVDGDPAMDSEAETYARLLATHADTLVASLSNLEPEFELADVLLDLSTTIQEYVTSTTATRRRRTATSSGSLRESTLPSTETITRVANEMRESLDRAVLILGPNARPDILREFIVQMIAETQLCSSRLRVLLLLLEHYLPQPRVMHQNEAGRAKDMGRAIWRDTHQWLQEVFHTTAADLAGEPFGHNEAVSVMDSLSTMAIEVMTFLEAGECSFGSSSPEPHTPDTLLLPPWDKPEIMQSEADGTEAECARRAFLAGLGDTQEDEGLLETAQGEEDPGDRACGADDRETATLGAVKRRRVQSQDQHRGQGSSSASLAATGVAPREGHTGTSRQGPGASTEGSPTKGRRGQTPSGTTTREGPKSLQASVDRIFGKK